MHSPRPKVAGELAMTKRFSIAWCFLRLAENRSIFGWLGASAASIVAGLWLIVTHYLPASSTQSARAAKAIGMKCQVETSERFARSHQQLTKRQVSSHTLVTSSLFLISLAAWSNPSTL